VVLSYHPNDSDVRDYARKAENGLATWAEIGMWAPVLYDNKSNANSVLEYPGQWICEHNPLGHQGKPAT
jgi:hypothetical protein